MLPSLISARTAARRSLPLSSLRNNPINGVDRRLFTADSLAAADSSVPGSAAYHFATVPPGTPVKAGWGGRAGIVGGLGTGSQCVHAGAQPDAAYNAVIPPVYLTSTFAFNDVRTNAGYDYTRSGNPTRAALEAALAALEGGEGAACTSTGMSAVLLALNLLPRGAHVLCTVDCYGGTFRTLEHARAAYGLDVHYVDCTDVAAVRAALRPHTKMVWVETPSNPLLRVTDVAAVAAAARQVGALTVVDNTFLSPALARPFESGADLVVHSTTKYLNGHSDVVGGAVVARRGATDLAQRIASLNNLLGISQSPFDCFLVSRGLKTLNLRMRTIGRAARQGWGVGVGVGVGVGGGGWKTRCGEGEGEEKEEAKRRRRTVLDGAGTRLQMRVRVDRLNGR